MNLSGTPKNWKSPALDARIESCDVVGPMLRFQLAVEGGESVALEGHVERYGEGFPTGSPVRVAWEPRRATIIPEAAR